MSAPAYEPSEHPRITPAVQWLLAFNVGIYFLQETIWKDLGLALMLDAGRFPEAWWQVGTYMFVHGGLWHLGANMLMLWMFGPRVEHAWNTRSFVYFYLWCGIGGAVAHLLFVHSGALVGASAAIMGVMLAYASRWPEDEIYVFGVIPMKVRWLMVWLVVINLGMGILDSAAGGIGWFAHLGGVVFGWLYLHGPSGGSLERIRQRVAAVPDDDEPPHPIPRTSSRRRSQPVGIDDIIAANNAMAEEEAGSAPPGSAVAKRRPMLPSVMPGLTAERAAEMNAVLDKISQYGLESLTREERRTLEEMSRRLRER
jgi:membrane associated rhomboid family serine protease